MYKQDHELKKLENKKRKEIIALIDNFLENNHDSEKIINYLEDECYLEISPPKKLIEKNKSLKIIDDHTYNFKGNSYKPGNIIINLKKAVFSTFLNLAENTVSAVDSLSNCQTVSGTSSNYQAVSGTISLLSILLLIAGLVKIKLSNLASLTLIITYNNSYLEKNSIEGVYSSLNDKLEAIGRNKITLREFFDVLDELENIKSISIDNNKINIEEKIKIKYR